MSYYSRGYNSRDGVDTVATVITIVIGIALIFIAIFGNSCSSSSWNNGVCPDCEVKYELRGVSYSLKYYACPECGQEVSRY